MAQSDIHWMEKEWVNKCWMTEYGPRKSFQYSVNKNILGSYKSVLKALRKIQHKLTTEFTRRKNISLHLHVKIFEGVQKQYLS